MYSEKENLLVLINDLDDNLAVIREDIDKIIVNEKEITKYFDLETDKEVDRTIIILQHKTGRIRSWITNDYLDRLKRNIKEAEKIQETIYRTLKEDFNVLNTTKETTPELEALRGNKNT